VDEKPKREFTTSTGRVIHLQPVSNKSLRDAERDVEAEFEAAGKPVAPPKYAVPLAGGGEKEFWHDEDSIKTAINEEKAAWAEHLKCLGELRIEQNERVMAVAIVRGVLEKPTDEWLEYMAWRGSKLPDNPYDLKVRYVTYEFLRTPEDMAAFVSATQLLSAGMEVSSDAIDAAMELFRDSIRQQTGPLLEALAAALGRGGQAKLDFQPGVPEGEGSAESGDRNERVRADEQG